MMTRRLRMFGFWTLLAMAFAAAPVFAHIVNVNSLNVRSGPGTSYAIVGTLSRGTQVTTVTTSGSWTQISAPKSGWVASAYLTDAPHLPLPNAWGASQIRPSSFVFPPYVNLRDSTIVVRWRTSGTTTGTVSYGKTTGYGSVARSTVAGTLHKVYLSGLTAATRYYYRVAIDGAGTAMTGTFTTPGLSRFRVAYLGETHCPGRASYTAKFATMIRKFSPHLVIESGDMVDYGTRDTDWMSYMQTSAPWLPHTIHLACHSNHVNGTGGNANLKNFFSLPNNERWYATRYGAFLNITLDSTFELNSDVGTTQIAWLKSQVAAAHDGVGDPLFLASTWHYPAYSSGPASRAGQRDWVRRNILSTFTANGGLDLIHVGHDKFTERSMIGKLPHVQTNAGELSPVMESTNPYKVYLNTATRSAFFVEIDATARTLKGWIVNPDGAILDWFVVRK